MDEGMRVKEGENTMGNYTREEVLQMAEDEDVEIIISNLMNIGRHQSMKMFDYGVLFTERENE